VTLQVAKCGEEVERDLELTGVTAIEDKLQVLPNFHAMFPSWCSTACLENFIT